MAIDPSGFSISVTEHGGRAVVTITGELDLATSPDLEEVVLGRLDSGQSVVLDLRELQFMDSSGLRVLIAAHTRASEGAAEFAVVRPAAGSEVEKILEIAGVEQQLQIVDEP
jgi:anti-sigma B factor antagonist